MNKLLQIVVILTTISFVHLIDGKNEKQIMMMDDLIYYGNFCNFYF